MRVKLSVTKFTDFQGKQDEFSNVYTYDGVTDSDDALNALADEVVSAERSCHGSDVIFRRVRIWNIGGVGPSTMRLTKDLSGEGMGGGSAQIYKECAQMVRWKLEPRIALFASTSNPARRISPYLRKFLHTTLAHGYNTSGSGGGNQPPPGGSLVDYARRITAPVAGVKLCNDRGEVPSEGPQFSRYLEHRQFPRGRKE